MCNGCLLSRCMSTDKTNLTRRSALKGLTSGTVLGLGAVAASSTAAANDCQVVTTCGEQCLDGVWVYEYECCDGDEWVEDCELVSEYCGMCP
jgi:hypothetical protein